MELFAIGLDGAREVEGATGVSVAGLVELPGEVAVNLLRYAAGSLLPEHPAGRPQLFAVLEGSGWVSGADRARRPIRARQAAYWSAGELHESGSEGGMLCVALQSPALDLPAGLKSLEHPAALRPVTPGEEDQASAVPRASDAVALRLVEVVLHVEKTLEGDRHTERVGLSTIRNERRRAMEAILVLLKDAGLQSYVAELRPFLRSARR